ncbi:MAG: lysophospholipid acyltransferase family protein [Desulfobacterales bacterium]|jgi:hypothetical protein|nr:lysophospholipid acyltransferase family protein [Desulfobacterales bacterium]
MHIAYNKIITSGIFQRILYHSIRLYSWTFRFSVENEEEWMTHLKQGGRVLLCTWHQQFFSAIRYFRKYKAYTPALMISRSKDGDIIAGIAQRTGWIPVRGSSSRGGKESLKEMIVRLKMTGLAAHIMDGPKGPMGKVKAGAVQLALSADAVIVPFYIKADRAWYFKSWDKFFIPKPFARVRLEYGRMIRLVQSESAHVFEAQRQKIEDIMAAGLILSGGRPVTSETEGK